jgi:hypothetical protein
VNDEATAYVGTDNVCGASLRPYTECTGNHRHAFADPAREGALLAGWATLHPKPGTEPAA